MTKSLLRLDCVARKIASEEVDQNELDQATDVQRSDEVGELAEAFHESAIAHVYKEANLYLCLSKLWAEEDLAHAITSELEQD